MAKFIVIYGINNIGKTTQCKKIVNYLKKRGLKTKYFKTPNYNLSSGKEIKKQLNKKTISEKSLQELYAINKFEQQKEVIKCLKNNINVIMEDYVATAFAWGPALGVDINYLKKIHKGLLKEDISILLDGNRFKVRNKHRFEKDNKLIDKVRKNHLELAKEYKWHVVDANQTKEKVFEEIKKVIKHNLFCHKF